MASIRLYVVQSLRFVWRQAAVVPVRPHSAVIADYRALSFAEAVVSPRRHPFGLQAPEAPLHWRIILAVTPTTHALLYLAAPQRLPVLPTGIMAALDAVEHHSRRTTA